MNIESIKELRKKAEEVVKDMPESDLKIKAFEITYTELLKGLGVPAESRGEQIAKNKGTSRKILETVTKLPKGATIILTQEDLEKLKKHFDDLPVDKLTGYTTVLFISEFIENIKGVDRWNYADIKLCYDALIRLGYDKAPTVRNIPQAVRDCISPSWKMQWFERDKEGRLSLSTYGIIKLNELRKKK